MHLTPDPSPEGEGGDKTAKTFLLLKERGEYSDRSSLPLKGKGLGDEVSYE